MPTALAGGLLIGSSHYRRQVLDCLRGLGCRAAPIALVREPAEGAVRLALALNGVA